LRATTKGAKEDLRRIRKHKLTHELTDDVESAKDFYENMYLPTIRARHGNTAISASFDELKSVLGKPGNRLLLIRHQGATIAGVVILIQEKPRLWFIFLRNTWPGGVIGRWALGEAAAFCMMGCFSTRANGTIAFADSIGTGWLPGC
jgi:hypothetical protein